MLTQSNEMTNLLFTREDMKLFIYRSLFAVLSIYSMLTQAQSAQIPTLKIAYLKQATPEFAGVPQHLKASVTDGIDGASTGIVDANKTGRFFNYQLALSIIEVPQSGILSKEQLQNAASATALLLDLRSSHFDDILKQLKQLDGHRLLLNVTNHEDTIRRRYCDMPLLHVAPSFQMKADALGQWYKTKRLNDVFVLTGNEPEDKQFAQAFLQTAKKFKLNIVAEKCIFGSGRILSPYRCKCIFRINNLSTGEVIGKLRSSVVIQAVGG